MNYEYDEEKIEKKVKISTIIISFLILFFMYVAGVGVWIYFFGLGNKVVKTTARFIPYPAAIIDGKIITAYELDNNLEAARQFYENQNFSDLGLKIDFSSPDGQKRLKVKEKAILAKMIDNTVIEQEANRRGIKLTSAQIDQEVNRKAEEYGSKDYLTQNISRLYGWSLTDFERNIVKPDLYQEQLYADMQKNDPDFKSAYAKIGQAKAALASGMAFSDVVAKYSDGTSTTNQGDLGWFTADQMLPEIAQVAFNLNVGQTSDIISSSLGYHIIKLEDKKTVDDTDEVRLSQVFVRTPLFVDWLAERENEMRIYITIGGLRWDKNSSQLEFTDKNMQSFENDLENNSQNDPSMMF